MISFFNQEENVVQHGIRMPPTPKDSNFQNEDKNRDRNDNSDNKEAGTAPQRSRRLNNASRPRGYFI
jgi:hypothetical protein